jgi:hypothetical protein
MAVASADPLLSINAAAAWLKAHGIHPATRHSVYQAIAHKRLRVFGSSGAVVLIRESELVKYAETRCESGGVRATH